MPISSSEFLAIIVLASIVFLSVWGFFAFADQDYRLRHTDTTVSITEDDQARDFDNLDSRQRQIFEEAGESEVYVSEDPFDFPDRVQRNDTYYDFRYSSIYDWTDPSTVLPILTFLGGLLGVVALLRRSVR